MYSILDCIAKETESKNEANNIAELIAQNT